MANKNDLFDFDETTAPNNDNIQGANIAENCAPSGINNAIRGLASIVKRAIGSQGSAIASAATTPIGAPGTALYTTITGTTAITSFGTVGAGTLRIIEFAGVLTLTHHATSLKLPGSANITTAAGDIAFMISLGSGNWKCLHYSRASGAPLAPIGTSHVSDNAVTYAKMQDVSAASRLLGRGSASGAGDPQEITLGSGLSMSGTTLGIVGGVIQQVVVTSNAATSTANNIPSDNTIPQNTEGAALFSQSFTPKSASSTIIIEAFVQVAHNTTGVELCLALFVNSGANAVSASLTEALATDGQTMNLVYSVESGSTSARTYSLRYGANSGTMFINRGSGGALFGGVMTSMLKITEVL